MHETIVSGAAKYYRLEEKRVTNTGVTLVLRAQVHTAASQHISSMQHNAHLYKWRKFIKQSLENRIYHTLPWFWT